MRPTLDAGGRQLRVYATGRGGNQASAVQAVSVGKPWTAPRPF
ncbi:hypothetical protein [Deinococcus metallilatus]|uniref:Uncharacterized protein n=1 Tax=Deinococcus metallilatus TaxID=1211322 RepID=A0ABR6MN71_9DEIO|nr:hypothetical protein [Deinococcus metallilatus]MBB5293384.1 hypothetical protein [Deinococcus metallilatus]